jgi:hypothetical protein
MQIANFAAVDEHLRKVLNVTLTNQLQFQRERGVSSYATIAPILVLYRYAEALPQNIIIHDVSVGGHESHLLGTELDFTYSERGHNAIRQAEVVSDLLRIRETMGPQVTAFRIGFYFDRFDNLEADTLDAFRDRYGSTRLVSNHLGIRYPWTSDDYRGAPAPRDYGYMAFWGRGSRTFGQGRRWEQRILSWNLGLLHTGHAALIAQRVLNDFRSLDRNPPSHIMLGAEVL